MDKNTVFLLLLLSTISLQDGGLVFGQDTDTDPNFQSGGEPLDRRAREEEPRISVDAGMTNITAINREKVAFTCLITGSPHPRYRWLHNGETIDEQTNSNINVKSIAYGSKLRISIATEADEGQYTCIGSNSVDSVNVTAYLTIVSIDEALSQTTRLPVPEIDPGLRDLFPEPDNQPTPQSDERLLDGPICQDYSGVYCNFLKNRPIYVTSRSQQYEAEQKIIETLPVLNIADSQSICLRQSIRAMCYYKMPVCGPGIQPTPQKICRNECEALYLACKDDFKNDQSKWDLLPDCSTLDNLPSCLKIGILPLSTTTTEHTPSKQPKTSGDVTLLLVTIIVPIILGLLVVLAVVLTVVCVCRRKKAQEIRSPSSTTSGRLSNITGSSKCGYEMAPSATSDKSVSVFMKDIPIDNVHFMQELGSGTFGKVFKGQVFGLYGNGTASTVFIKSLNAQAKMPEIQDFQNEMNSLTELRHQHIVTLLGVSTKGNPQCILYEFLPMGDLKQFLLAQEAHGSPLQHKEIMYILTQIVSGLEYLASQQFIHKDIAARNIIVGQNLNVKLSNLKIVYGLHSADYCMIHNSMMPIRWLPPETITYAQYTLETDIYMYGVLMWEVFSSAQQPYSGFANDEVVEMVRSRQLLSCPADCPPRAYSLMMECWHEKQNKRPEAKEVHQKMRAWYLDNSNVYSMGSTTAPSVSNSTAPSHHSSTGPSNPSNKTNLTDARSAEASISPTSHNTPSRQVDAPPYYNTLYTDGICPPQSTLQCQNIHNSNGFNPEDSSIESSGSSLDDEESEFQMPTPVNITGNHYNSLTRKPLQVRVNYQNNHMPYTQQDQV